MSKIQKMFFSFRQYMNTDTVGRSIIPDKSFRHLFFDLFGLNRQNHSPSTRISNNHKEPSLANTVGAHPILVLWWCLGRLKCLESHFGHFSSNAWQFHFSSKKSCFSAIRILQVLRWVTIRCRKHVLSYRARRISTFKKNNF